MGFSSFFEKIRNEKAKKETPEYLKQKLEVETLKLKIRKVQNKSERPSQFGLMIKQSGIKFDPNPNAIFGSSTVKARKAK